MNESHNQLPVQIANPTLFDSRGFIAGKWRCAASNKTFAVIEPSSGQILAHCADFSQQEFVEAIEEADRGFREYFLHTNAKQRSSLLRKWNDLILQNVDDLATILSLENGKTLAEAKGEVTYAASFVSWFAEEAVRSYGDVIPSSYQNTTALTFKEPVGVCGIITPWNFPAAMITRKIAPAFAAGCSVVIKPPSETPFTAIALVRLALEAGFPPDIVNVVPTKDRNASLELATHPKVKKISFTGSTNVGKMLTKLAAGTIKRVSMELGGNAPFIVFNDADVEKAIEGALICKFRSSGQTCVCANRLYVHENVLEEFTQGLIRRVQSFKLGRGIDKGVTHGPLVNSAAVDKVKNHVQDAIQKGGQLRYGGDVPADTPPAIFSFSSEDEVIEMANDTEFGLAGYFFSENINRVLRVAQRLECGMIGVNTGLISAVETPFGGVKESGIGREGSKYGLGEYQNIKAVTIGGSSA
ncbi:Aldehyde dehydrogenase N-terminal [Penicillium concentricum]|uniref:Succinate-semialdehyde dehydrogenase, mitochondrial n=1 Tax=Penicillium concentricum TaxID=293559 RepID=A0A9W9RJJ9_9EURO|nr:Aldehyde dehydrogenase N-terminal [Penicillium concentricum]KAJ5360464.1 Aldehyde dehydrogenase N-terminal [Penicillium concentricum]